MKTRNLIVISLLAALSIVLTRFLSFMLPVAGILGIRISFGDIPIMLAGLLFGPIAGALTGIVADVIGAVFLSPYGFFPGFTLTAALVGAIPPIIIRLMSKKDIKFIHLFLAILVTDIITSLGLNTLWLTMMNGKAFMVLLPPRIVARAVLIVPNTMLTFALYKVTKKLVK